jgi:hypothetical protein
MSGVSSMRTLRADRRPSAWTSVPRAATARRSSWGTGTGTPCYQSFYPFEVYRDPRDDGTDKPAPGIQELLESARREMERACSVPANLTCGHELQFYSARRAGKTSYLEALREAVLREATESAALSLSRWAESAALSLSRWAISKVNLNEHWLAAIEEPEPGEREMSAVRAMCRGL